MWVLDANGQGVNLARAEQLLISTRRDPDTVVVVARFGPGRDVPVWVVDGDTLAERLRAAERYVNSILAGSNASMASTPERRTPLVGREART